MRIIGHVQEDVQNREILTHTLFLSGSASVSVWENACATLACLEVMMNMYVVEIHEAKYFNCGKPSSFVCVVVGPWPFFVCEITNLSFLVLTTKRNP